MRKSTIEHKVFHSLADLVFGLVRFPRCRCTILNEFRIIQNVQGDTTILTDGKYRLENVLHNKLTFIITNERSERRSP